MGRRTGRGIGGEDKPMESLETRRQQRLGNDDNRSAGEVGGRGQQDGGGDQAGFAVACRDMTSLRAIVFVIGKAEFGKATVGQRERSDLGR